MNHDTEEETALKIRAAAAGMALPADRVQALLPALRRLEATERRLRALDLDFTEPALVFDAQEDGGGVGRE